jgi:hypothetical protein
MGERYCQLVYGVLESELPECPGPYEPGDEDNNWSNWMSDSSRVQIICEEEGVPWDSSYESKPRVLGFVALGGDAYTTWELAGVEVLERQHKAASAWERFRDLVQEQLGLVLPRGRVFLVFDHT